MMKKFCNHETRKEENRKVVCRVSGSCLCTLWVSSVNSVFDQEQRFGPQNAQTEAAQKAQTEAAQKDRRSRRPGEAGTQKGDSELDEPPLLTRGLVHSTFHTRPSSLVTIMRPP